MEQKQYSQIKKAERLEIAILLKKQYSLREIAKVLKRDHGTLSREIKRNLVRGIYDPLKANHKAYVRRKYAKYQGEKIASNNLLRTYVEERLKMFWSPEVISGRMKLEQHPFYVNKNTIYEWLYGSYGQALCPYLYSQRYVPRKRHKKRTKKSLIPNRIGIEQRPGIVSLNKEYGHYEGDTMVSGKKTASKTALSVIYERKAKYVNARKISNLKPSANRHAILEMKQWLRMLTMTLDNGVENREHEGFGVSTFFCDSYSAWQKGGIENVNKLIRRFIPKSSDIGQYSNEYIKMVIDILNNTPRKSLNYKMPQEVMIENNQFKQLNQYVNLNLDVKNKIPSGALGGGI